ncbi:MAG TPA: hypothetical protein VGE34_04125 [Candidatus Saccharimonadales bacterium]
MWENVINVPRGRISARKFMFLLVTFLVTLFGYAFVASTPVFAADAEWKGNELVYNKHTYTGPVTATTGDGLNLPTNTQYYVYEEPAAANTPTKAHVIYFAPGADPPTEKQATLASYDLTNGVYSNKTNTRSISLTPQPTPKNTNNLSSCELDGIGWLVCPASKWIAEGMDYLYGIVESFLRVEPLATTNASGNAYGIYQMWKIMLNIANVGFIIGFLILIYGQITGGTVSNYTIKKLLPRIIVAAVLVNISYWVCSLAVDLSNVLGTSVQQLFMSMFDQLGAANSQGSHVNLSSVNWSSVTAAALSGTAVIGGFAFLSGGVGVSAGALALTIVVALIPAVFAVFVAVAILAARQALITIFIIISPLAFVAYLMPNTEEWFKRWRKLFISMLVMFPAFAVVFGGAQLAGKVIIQTADSMPIVILGLVVQVVPLFITPFLIKLSSGLLSTIAGLSNDKSKGVFDWAKNDLTARRDAKRSAAQARGLNRLDSSKWGNSDNRFKRGVRRTASGAYLSTGDKRRDARKSMYDNAIGGYSEGYANRGRQGFRAYELSKGGGLAKDAADHSNQLRYEQKMSKLEEHRAQPRGPLGKRLQANEDRRYNQYRHLEHESHEGHDIADALEKGRGERGKAKLMTAIQQGKDGSYEAQLRDYMTETQFQTRIGNSATATIQHLGDTKFDRAAYDDELVRQIRLTEGLAEDRMKTAKAAQEKLFTELRVDGSRVLGDGASVSLRAMADEMKNESIKQKVIEDAVKNATIKDQDQYAKIVRHNETLQEVVGSDVNWADVTQTIQQVGGGIANFSTNDQGIVEASREGSQRMLSRARKERSARLGENVENARAILSEMAPQQLVDLIADKKYKDESGNVVEASVEEIAAAQYELLENKGNREIVLALWQKNAREHGMVFDEDTGRHYMPDRDEVTGEIKMEADGKTPKRKGDWLDAEKVEEHADMQQFFIDGLSKSKHSITMLSGTEAGLFKAGMGTQTARDALRKELEDGKIPASDLPGTNIDEYDEWIRMLRDPKYRSKLSEATRQSMISKIRQAQQTGQMEDRIFNASSVVANYLEIGGEDDNKFPDTPENRAKFEKDIKYVEKVNPDTNVVTKYRVALDSTDTVDNLTVKTVDNVRADGRERIRSVRDTRRYGAALDERNPQQP